MQKSIFQVNSNLAIWQALRPLNVPNLTRVGKFKDGGYVVPLEYLEKLTTFVNFGVGEDFDFEIELRRKYGVINIQSYDSLVSIKYFLIHFLKGLIKFFIFRSNVHVVFQRFILLSKFFYFYSLLRNINFHKVKIVKSNAETILSDLPQDSALKVDIEGSEYLILDTICENKSNLTFLIIEFHSIQLNQSVILDFVKKLGSEFFIAHLSINNRNSEIDLLPQTIEVTFCRDDGKSKDFVSRVPNDEFDWNFPNRPIYQINYIH
jgi:hypothetical protein